VSYVFAEGVVEGDALRDAVVADDGDALTDAVMVVKSMFEGEVPTDTVVVDEGDTLSDVVVVVEGVFDGDMVAFTPDSEYEFLVNGEKLYRMFTRNICIAWTSQK
jgi:hypothetical protein